MLAKNIYASLILMLLGACAPMMSNNDDVNKQSEKISNEQSEKISAAAFQSVPSIQAAVGPYKKSSVSMDRVGSCIARGRKAVLKMRNPQADAELADLYEKCSMYFMNRNEYQKNLMLDASKDANNAQTLADYKEQQLVVQRLEALNYTNEHAPKASGFSSLFRNNLATVAAAAAGAYFGAGYSYKKLAKDKDKEISWLCIASAIVVGGMMMYNKHITAQEAQARQDFLNARWGYSGQEEDYNPQEEYNKE